MADLQVQEDQAARAERLHREAIVVDISVRGLNWQNLRKGGVTASIVTVNALFSGMAETAEEVMASIAVYLDNVYAHPDELTLIKSPDDIRATKAAGKTGYIFHMQGLGEIGQRLYWIEILSRIGVRLMSVTYNGVNQMGSGPGEREDTGLTYFGRQVIREMNRVGVVVDLSHLGFRSAREALEVSEGPIVLSHGSPYDLVKNNRNAPADVMKAVAERGGVMGISAFAPVLDSGDGKFPTLDTMLDHIDYAVERLGIDHVAIGTDHSEGSSTRWRLNLLRQQDLRPAYTLRPPYSLDWSYHAVEGFKSAADMPKITAGLVARGYSDEDVKKIMGENWLRVFDRTWGARLRAESPSAKTS